MGCIVRRVSALPSIFPIDRTAGVEAPTVAIFSFVPAGGSVRRRNHCRKVVRKLSEAMGVCLTAEGDGRAVLLADFSGRNWLPRLCHVPGLSRMPVRRKPRGVEDVGSGVCGRAKRCGFDRGRATRGGMVAAQAATIAADCCWSPRTGVGPRAGSRGITGCRRAASSGRTATWNGCPWLPLCGVLKTASQVAGVARRMALD